MNQYIEIEVEVLRQVTEVLLDHLEAVEGSLVRVEHDFFWAIPYELRTNVYVEPSEFTIGQLADSIDNLERIRTGVTDATPYALVWLADALRAVGEEAIR